MPIQTAKKKRIAGNKIVEYLKRYNGEGIQHIVVGAKDIYEVADEIASRGLIFMPSPPNAYYELSKSRVVDHEEPLDRMMRHGHLDRWERCLRRRGNTHSIADLLEDRHRADLSRIHSAQRRWWIWKSNIKALFVSIEADQIARGVFKAS